MIRPQGKWLCQEYTYCLPLYFSTVSHQLCIKKIIQNSVNFVHNIVYKRVKSDLYACCSSLNKKTKNSIYFNLTMPAFGLILPNIYEAFCDALVQLIIASILLFFYSRPLFQRLLIYFLHMGGTQFSFTGRLRRHYSRAGLSSL